jgi:hypothetical protein
LAAGGDTLARHSLCLPTITATSAALTADDPVAAAAGAASCTTGAIAAGAGSGSVTGAAAATGSGAADAESGWPISQR